MVQLLCTRPRAPCAHRFIHRLFASVLVHRAIAHHDAVSRSRSSIRSKCREMLRKRLIYDLLFPFARAPKNQAKSDSVTSAFKLTAFSADVRFEQIYHRCVETRVFNNNRLKITEMRKRRTLLFDYFLKESRKLR